jgi:hypothetical protein
MLVRALIASPMRHVQVLGAHRLPLEPGTVTDRPPAQAFLFSLIPSFPSRI